MLGKPIDSYELSPMQAGMLFNASTRPCSGVDIEQAVARPMEPTDTEVLAGAWRRVLQRHPILRSSFRWEDCPRPVQEVWGQVELPVIKLDWSERDPAEQDCLLAEFLASDRRQGLELGQAPQSRRFRPNQQVRALPDGQTIAVLGQRLLSGQSHRRKVWFAQRARRRKF